MENLSIIILKKYLNLKQLVGNSKNINSGTAASICKGRSLTDFSFTSEEVLPPQINSKAAKNLFNKYKDNREFFFTEELLFFIHSLFQNDLVSGSIFVDIFRKFKNIISFLSPQVIQSSGKTTKLFLLYKSIEGETLPGLLPCFFQNPSLFVSIKPLDLILKAIFESNLEFSFFLKLFCQKSQTKMSFSKNFKESKGMVWEIIINKLNKKNRFLGGEIFYRIESSILGNLLNVSPDTFGDLFLKSSFLSLFLPNLLKFYLKSSSFKKKNTIRFPANTVPFFTTSSTDLIILLQSIEMNGKKKLIISLRKKLQVNKFPGPINFLSIHPLISRMEKKLKILSFW